MIQSQAALRGGLLAVRASVGSVGTARKSRDAAHRVEGDTSCMKAHVVKWACFCCCFSFSRVSTRPCLVRLFGGSSFCISFLGVLSFVFGWLSMLFVMNHVFAVASGMSLC